VSTPRVYTAVEVAQLLGCDPKHVRTLASDGLISAFDIAQPGANCSWRFPRAGLHEFLVRRGLSPEEAAAHLDGFSGMDGIDGTAADSIAPPDVSGSPT
jgi:hypothetical protein